MSLRGVTIATLQKDGATFLALDIPEGGLTDVQCY